MRPAVAAPLLFLKCTNNHHSCRACCNIYRWSQLFFFKRPVLLSASISVYVFLTIVSQTSLCGLFSTELPRNRGPVLQPACMHSSNTNKQRKGVKIISFYFFFHECRSEWSHFYQLFMADSADTTLDTLQSHLLCFQ